MGLPTLFSLAIAAAVLLAAPSPSAAQILAGVETTRSRAVYRFSNPSSFDTAELVPHFFEQRYDTDNVWLTLTWRFSALAQWETQVGFTPERQASATDYDTFFNPDGTVWVSGTSGDALMRSFRFTERATVGRFRSLAVFAGYTWRLDRANFLLGHKSVTRNGVVTEMFDVTTREMTSGQSHELFVGASLTADAGRGWKWIAAGDLAPAAIGRLLVQLPDKYPNRDLIFVSKDLAASGRLSLVRTGTTGTHWPIELSIEAGRTWSYRSSDSSGRRRLGASVLVGYAWTPAAAS